MRKRMLHLWIRAEQRKNEKRVGITPQDASKLICRGIKVTVEESADRIISTEEYHKVGCKITNQHSWPREIPPTKPNSSASVVKIKSVCFSGRKLSLD